jgi:DNA-binding MarR family transcriptional regulator
MKSRTKRNFKLVEPLSDAQIGLEARAQVDDHLDIEVWLRLLACSTQIEQSVRQHLRSCFGTTLPRFDYMAQLDRHPEGLSMKALSCHLMVTCGNVTGVTDPLVSEGLVERLSEPGDRRSWRVRLPRDARRSP